MFYLTGQGNSLVRSCLTQFKSTPIDCSNRDVVQRSPMSRLSIKKHIGPADYRLDSLTNVKSLLNTNNAKSGPLRALKHCIIQQSDIRD